MLINQSLWISVSHCFLFLLTLSLKANFLKFLKWNFLMVSWKPLEEPSSLINMEIKLFFYLRHLWRLMLDLHKFRHLQLFQKLQYTQAVFIHFFIKWDRWSGFLQHLLTFRYNVEFSYFSWPDIFFWIDHRMRNTTLFIQASTNQVWNGLLRMVDSIWFGGKLCDAT